LWLEKVGTPQEKNLSLSEANNLFQSISKTQAQFLYLAQCALNSKIVSSFTQSTLSQLFLKNVFLSTKLAFIWQLS